MRFWIALVVLFVCGLFVGNEYLFSSHWNYRITVTVETPEGIKTGSAVRQIEAWRQPQIGESPPVLYQVYGEAVVVDLGKRGQLFALISWASYTEVHAAIPVGLTDHVAELRHYRSLKGGTKGTLPRASYPRLVTFADINDPKSVKAVDPDAFHATFGEGVHLKDITIEITSDPETWYVGKVLPWLSDFYNKRLDGQRHGVSGAENRLANSLSSGAFSTGR